MPQSETIEDIKTYQAKVENNKITPEALSSCVRCNLESKFFRIHAYRERRFLIIVELLIQAVMCTLVRFRCPDCGKTFTYYPDFAIPRKHYTRQAVESFSMSYVEDDQKTYKKAAAIDEAVPERQDSSQALSPSTIHRWVSTLAGFFIACQKEVAKKKFSQRFCFRHSRLTIPGKKYRTVKRRACLLRCGLFIKAVSFYKHQFSPSLE